MVMNPQEDGIAFLLPKFLNPGMNFLECIIGEQHRSQTTIAPRRLSFAVHQDLCAYLEWGEQPLQRAVDDTFANAASGPCVGIRIIPKQLGDSVFQLLLESGPAAMLVNGLHTADFPDEDKSVMLRKPLGIFQMLVNGRE
jgi:hypothetical protein